MKIAFQAVRIGLSALALGAAAVQGAQFFRIAGPVATSITSLTADGYITWTNLPTNATFIVQVTPSLPGGSNWIDYVRVPATRAMTAQRIYDPNSPPGMALIPAGSFTMGDTLDGGGPNHDSVPTVTVYVSAFYMDVNLVSYSQWQTVYNWATSHGYGFDNAGSGKAASHPVQSINWYDCVKWCNARSEREGRTPAYYTESALSVPYRSGQVAPYVSWSAGYRLPTEAEWEKAARGGTSGQRFPWGDTISWSRANYYAHPDWFAWDLATPIGYDPAFNDGVEPYTSPVGYFAPNGYGLYDMAGNVGEWCWDWYGRPYAGGNDPRGPVSGYYRVSRGGYWSGIETASRTAFRNIYDPTTNWYVNGFRSVLPAVQ